MLMIFNRVRGRDGVTIFNRTVPAEILSRTIAIVLASAISVLVIASVLLLAAGAPEAHAQASRHLFVEYVFETLSAFGTVGLSMNVTSSLERHPEAGHHPADVHRPGRAAHPGLRLVDVETRAWSTPRKR